MSTFNYSIVDRNGKETSLKEYKEKVVERYLPTFKPKDIKNIIA